MLYYISLYVAIAYVQYEMPLEQTNKNKTVRIVQKRRLCCFFYNLLVLKLWVDSIRGKQKQRCRLVP